MASQLKPLTTPQTEAATDVPDLWHELDDAGRLAYLESGQAVAVKSLLASLMSDDAVLREKCQELIEEYVFVTLQLLGLYVPSPTTTPEPDTEAQTKPAKVKKHTTTACVTPELPLLDAVLPALSPQLLTQLKGAIARAQTTNQPTVSESFTETSLAPAATPPATTEQSAPPTPKRRGPRQATAPLARNGYLRFPCDRVNKAIVESLVPKALREVAPDFLRQQGIYASAFWRAYPFEENSKRRGNITGAVGLTTEPAQAIWEAVQCNGALAVKVQFALWSLAYAETNAEAGKFISVSLSDLCDKLGYKRKRGAHKRENRENVLGVLEYLTSIHIAVSYTTPKGKSVQLDGPLWVRGAIQREAHSEPGTPPVPGSWTPVIFLYAPGYFFSNNTWRAYNKDVALVGEGLLQLSAGSEDKWAVMVCGYLVTLARMNGYRPARIRAETLLLKTGLWEAKRQEPGRMFGTLHRALDRACEVEVLKSWTPVDNLDPALEYDDLDATETRLAVAEPNRYVTDKLRECYLIEWPDALTAHGQRLQQAQVQHSSQATTSSSRRAEGTTPKTD